MFKQVANWVKESARVREESFDATVAKDPSWNGVWETCYKLSLYQAVEQVVEVESMRVPVYLLLANSWNDILAWANE